MSEKTHIFEGVSKTVQSKRAQSSIVAGRTMTVAVEKAVELAAVELCTAEGKRPCGVCRDCRKVTQGIHPDVIKIGLPLDDKGKEKKEIQVDQIRAMISDTYILPNESRGKVYIIENADCMNLAAQNAALKLLEEPPAGVVILLCAVNIRKLLPTVRSRCAEIDCGGELPEDDAAMTKLALEYLDTAAKGPKSRQCAFCFANEGMDAASAALFISCLKDIAADMLTERRDNMGMSTERLMEMYKLLEQCSTYLKVNTGVKHVFGLLSIF